MKVSVVVPAKNESADLPRLIKSLAFADEIIVIDTGSTDNTIAIAQELGAKVVREKMVNFSQIRNFGSQLAVNDWILSIDADNEVPPELSDEIAKLPEEPYAYKIGRINIIWGKPILHADWGPDDDCHIRLYHRAEGGFEGQVHEQYVTKLKTKKLKSHLLHHNYSSVTEYLTKLNYYSDITAAHRRSQGLRFFVVNLFTEPLYDFFKRYFYKLGFLEGAHGLYLCILQSIYYLSVGIKLGQLKIKN